MHYTKLIKIWNPIFRKLGYRKINIHNWFYETGELIVVLSLKVNEVEKQFYFDIGILIKKLQSDRSLKKPVFEDYDIGQGLYFFLLDTGELEPYLNNLFCYDSQINTDDEIKNNCTELPKLFKLKAVPYIQKLDSYAWLVDGNFEEVASWKPFLKYFQASYDHDYDFNGELEAFYFSRRKDSD
jgi:hypothetical protein